MSESRTVTIGLDVHDASVRLAAVRADELLEERTLPYEHQAVERAVRRWPRGAIRCPQPRGQPHDRGSPLDVLLHVRRGRAAPAARPAAPARTGAPEGGAGPPGARGAPGGGGS